MGLAETVGDTSQLEYLARDSIGSSICHASEDRQRPYRHRYPHSLYRRRSRISSRFRRQRLPIRRRLQRLSARGGCSDHNNLPTKFFVFPLLTTMCERRRPDGESQAR